MANRAFGQNEIIIEVDHPKNSGVIFYPANTTLRSRFLPSRTPGKMPHCLREFAVEGIPGHRVHLDVKARKARIADVMADDSSKKLLERVKNAGLSLQNEGKFPLVIGDPLPEKLFSDLSDEQIQTWLYWMRRLVDGCKRHNYENPTQDEQFPENDKTELVSWARLVQGQLPSQKEILRTGKVKRTKYSGFSKAPPYITLPEHELAQASKEAK